MAFGHFRRQFISEMVNVFRFEKTKDCPEFSGLIERVCDIISHSICGMLECVFLPADRELIICEIFPGGSKPRPLSRRENCAIEGAGGDFHCHRTERSGTRNESRQESGERSHCPRRENPSTKIIK